MKRFVALARVSSREQEREGFSLAVQEEALRRYAQTTGGEIVRFFRIAETASKSEERRSFRELIAFAKKHAAELDALLFYKVDRAARNARIGAARVHSWHAAIRHHAGRTDPVQSSRRIWRRRTR